MILTERFVCLRLRGVSEWVSVVFFFVQLRMELSSSSSSLYAHSIIPTWNSSFKLPIAANSTNKPSLFFSPFSKHLPSIALSHHHYSTFSTHVSTSKRPISIRVWCVCFFPLMFQFLFVLLYFPPIFSVFHLFPYSLYNNTHLIYPNFGYCLIYESVNVLYFIPLNFNYFYLSCNFVILCKIIIPYFYIPIFYI